VFSHPLCVRDAVLSKVRHLRGQVVDVDHDRTRSLVLEVNLHLGLASPDSLDRLRRLRGEGRNLSLHGGDRGLHRRHDRFRVLDVGDLLLDLVHATGHGDGELTRRLPVRLQILHPLEHVGEFRLEL
jgi:hypothetical protein